MVGREADRSRHENLLAATRVGEEGPANNCCASKRSDSGARAGARHSNIAPALAHSRPAGAQATVEKNAPQREVLRQRATLRRPEYPGTAPMAARRTAAKLIRFDPDELTQIVRRAHDCGRTPARFIREAALGAIPRPRHHAAGDAMLRELAHVGGELDQLARLVATGRSVPLPESLTARLSSALDAHTALVQHVLQGRASDVAGQPETAS